MKSFQKLFLILVCFSFTTGIYGQELKENEVVVIKGEKYVLHQIRTGETVYSLAKRFRVDSLTIVSHNPHIAEAGLKIGEILKIPYKEEADLKDQPVYLKGDPTRFDSYTIRSRRETPYFIAKSHGITVEEIFAYNPGVGKFRKGLEIRIPRWDKPSVPEQGKQDETKPAIITQEDTVTAEEPVDEEKDKELIRHNCSSGRPCIHYRGDTGFLKVKYCL